MRALGGQTEAERLAKQARWGVAQLASGEGEERGEVAGKLPEDQELEFINGLAVLPLSRDGPLWNGVHIERTRANTPEQANEAANEAAAMEGGGVQETVVDWGSLHEQE
eukprot:COSAG05_NODE_15612_length_365_cov_0.973684_1_plen_109_part_01